MGALAVLLGTNAFWNGIVSVFVMVLYGLMPINNPPQGGQWWAMFVFLIPFEAIGLAMFAGLLLVLAEPLRRTVWRFEYDRIVGRTSWRICGFSRGWDVLALDRLELRRRGRQDQQGKANVKLMTDLNGERTFELVLVSADNVDLCRIESLTEGEARWMAGIVLKRRPEWFGQRTARL